MTMPGDYSEELVELVARTVADRTPGAAWALLGELGRFKFEADARAILDALSSAGRLVPEGSEVREEWGTRRTMTDGSSIDWAEMSERSARRVMRDRSGPTALLHRHRITTPWTPSEPAQEVES